MMGSAGSWAQARSLRMLFQEIESVFPFARRDVGNNEGRIFILLN